MPQIQLAPTQKQFSIQHIPPKRLEVVTVCALNQLAKPASWETITTPQTHQCGQAGQMTSATFNWEQFLSLSTCYPQQASQLA